MPSVLVVYGVNNYKFEEIFYPDRGFAHLVPCFQFNL